eukprot:1929571-Amphidinium_carterae.1
MQHGASLRFCRGSHTQGAHHDAPSEVTMETPRRYDARLNHASCKGTRCPGSVPQSRAFSCSAAMDFPHLKSMTCSVRLHRVVNH